MRSDLTTSFGDASGTAEGVPMTLQLTVVDASTGDALPGVAVYLLHCTADGRYSIYEIEDQNYLRGVQETDDAGDCDAAYTDSRYGQSAGNLAQLSLTSDMVFPDGWSDQLATVVGSIREGYTASLLVRV